MTLEHHSPEKRLDLAILEEAWTTLNRSGAEFQLTMSGRGGLMPDAVLINGTVGVGLDSAVKAHTGYGVDELRTDTTSRCSGRTRVGPDCSPSTRSAGGAGGRL